MRGNKKLQIFHFNYKYKVKPPYTYKKYLIKKEIKNYG